MAKLTRRERATRRGRRRERKRERMRERRRSMRRDEMRRGFLRMRQILPDDQQSEQIHN